MSFHFKYTIIKSFNNIRPFILCFFFVLMAHCLDKSVLEKLPTSSSETPTDNSSSNKDPSSSSPSAPFDLPNEEIENGGEDVNEDGSYNYAAALQKALFFYDAERSGDLPNDFRVSWRGDSELCDGVVSLNEDNTNLSQSFINNNEDVLDPDGDGTIDVSGGFHDAGDHVKFGLPQSYAASTLGWAVYEFKDQFLNTKQYSYVMDILKWFSDDFIKSTFRDNTGNVVAFAYQMGEGSIDHNYWGPPELQSCDDYPRPVYFATEDDPASDQAAGAAAALALMSLNSHDVDEEYALTCLDTAEALYNFAKENRGLGYSGGFYPSSADEDELSWAAIWLYEATHNASYLTDIVQTSGTAYTGYLKSIISNTQDSWQNVWTHCWDTVWTGVILKLADITEDSFYQNISKWNLEYWSGISHDDASDTSHIEITDAGYSFLSIWGSARYNTTEQFMALLYQKYFGDTSFATWAKGQMDYLMGNNPMHRSYLVGFTDSYAEHPHHRAAHGSTTNSMYDPPNHRHVLYGALVGGPDANDFHNDQTNDYIYNEVAIDYNAGFVGALVGLYQYYGHYENPLSNFPPEEDTIDDEYRITAKIEQENGQRTQVTLTLNATPYYPPRFVSGLKARYFFSIQELLDHGQDIHNVKVEVYYDSGESIYGEPVQIQGPSIWDETNKIYYYEIDWSHYEIFGARTIQFAIIADLASDYFYHWDPTNDFSHNGLSSIEVNTPYIPIYLSGDLLEGEEP